MDVEETRIVTTFISAWGWQILAMLFLCSSLTVFTIPRTQISTPILIIFFLLFIGCEFASLARKKKVMEENNE